MDPQRQLVGELRLAYYESGLTYAQIAARAEVDPDTVYRALNGERILVATLVRLCHALDRAIIILPAA